MLKISFEERARLYREQIIPARDRMWKKAIDVNVDPFHGKGTVKSKHEVDTAVQDLIKTEEIIKEMVKLLAPQFKTFSSATLRKHSDMLPDSFIKISNAYLKIIKVVTEGLLIYKNVPDTKSAQMFKKIHDLAIQRLTSSTTILNFVAALIDSKKTDEQKGLNSGKHLVDLYNHLPDKDPNNQQETLIIDNVRIHFAVVLDPSDHAAIVKDIQTAFTAIKNSKVPHFAKVLYGDMFIVHTDYEANAYYEPRTDLIWVNTRKAAVGSYPWNIIHEYGHRYYKTLDATDKKNWQTFYRNMNSYQNQKEYRARVQPKVGDSFWNDFGLATQVKVKNKMEWSIPGQDNIVEDLGNGVYLFEFHDGSKAPISLDLLSRAVNAPSTYALTDSEEYFCEIIAAYSLNKLRPNIRDLIAKGFEDHFIAPYVSVPTQQPVVTTLPPNLKKLSSAEFKTFMGNVYMLSHEDSKHPISQHVTKDQISKLKDIWDKYSPKDHTSGEIFVHIEDFIYLNNVLDEAHEKLNLAEIAEEEEANRRALEEEERLRAEEERKKAEEERKKAEEHAKQKHETPQNTVTIDDMILFVIANGSDSQVKFVKSLASQFSRTGVLSEKQVAVLKKMYAEARSMKGDIGIDKSGLSHENHLLLEKLEMLEQKAKAKGNDFAEKFARSLAVELASRKTLNLSDSQAKVLKRLFSQFGLSI